MTILCAMREEGVGTWIGCDTLITVNTGIGGYKDKWIKGDGFWLGVAGSLTATDLMQDNIAKITSYITAGSLWKLCRDLLKEADFKCETKDGEPPWYHIGLMFATKDRLFSIGGAGGGIDFGNGAFSSRGSGADVADGAAYVLRKNNATCEQTVFGAIEAAIAFDTCCGGDIIVRCITE